MTGTSESKSDASAGVTVDITSPYYIAASDSPNAVFVSDLLRDGNYADWADEMSNALFAKNKFGFVDGSIAIPKEGAADSLVWRRCNAMVKGWLHSSMEKDIRNSVKHAITAQEIWEDLRERFGSESAPRAYELKREITHTRQEKLSVSAYYTKLKGIWDEIHSISPVPKCKCTGCTCGLSKQLVEMREKEHLYEFLMGLDESFGTIKTQILSTKPMVSLAAAYHLVSEDEKQKQITNNGRINVEASAFQTHGFRQPGKDEAKAGQKEKPRCTHCGKFYHTVDNCYEIIGYPEGRKKGGDTKGKPKMTGKSAHFAAGEESPIPGLSAQNYATLIQYINATGESV